MRFSARHVLLIFVVANASAAPSLVQLEGILDRAITMMGAFIGDGVPFTPGFSDNLLLLQKVPLHSSSLPSPNATVYSAYKLSHARIMLVPPLQVESLMYGDLNHRSSSALKLSK
jgi:hypothetical protein